MLKILKRLIKQELNNWLPFFYGNALIATLIAK